MEIGGCDSVGVFLALYWILCATAAFVALRSWSWTDDFKALVMLSAARGKTWATRDRRWGSVSDWSVPQFYFWHFYAVAIVMTLATWHMSEQLMLPSETAMHLHEGHEKGLLYGLFLVHVLRRLIETWCLLRYPPSAKMHLFAYLYGLSYYVVVPLSISFPFTCTDSSLSSVWNLIAPSNLISSDSFLKSRWVPLMGILVYVAGFAIQSHSHLLLSKLHTTHQDSYSIPKGGLFEQVSCPHYLGEILIYSGLALISFLSPLMILINAWVVFNLVLGAREMHEWYLKRFPDYPKSRAALVPFLF